VTTPGSHIDFEFEALALDNGLRVVMQPDRSSPAVAVHVMYHVGSKDEPSGRTGFAHLFEHLLFQGSANVGETEHFRLVQESGGTLNGSTWFDRTNYFETVPSNALDLALWLEADRMGWFLPTITQKKLDNQRDVVKNERRQSYENRPYGLATETVLRHAFPTGHPYRHPTIGYMEDLDRATLDDVKTFFRQWYGPGNALLVVSGDFDPATLPDKVRRYFGDIPAAPSAARVRVEPSSIRAEARASLVDDVTVPRVYMMFHAPSFQDDDFETSGVLGSLLAGGRGSRLYRDLVYERQIAADVQAYVWPLEKLGMLWVVATARQGVGAVELEGGVWETLTKLAAEGPREEEASGACRRVRRRLLLRLESVTGRADLLAHAAVLRGDPGYVNTAFDRYASVGGDDIGRLAADLLTSDNRTVLHVVPGTDGASGAPESSREGSR
jgi:predicted Zn-dependent peptidase